MELVDVVGVDCVWGVELLPPPRAVGGGTETPGENPRVASMMLIMLACIAARIANRSSRDWLGCVACASIFDVKFEIDCLTSETSCCITDMSCCITDMLCCSGSMALSTRRLCTASACTNEWRV